MAEYYATLEREFDAGHSVRGFDGCEMPGHGHRFRIAVTSQERFEPSRGFSNDLSVPREVLNDLLSEISGRDLNVMLPGIIPSPEGLGQWILERMLSAGLRSITEVRVWIDAQRSYSIRRQPR